MKKFVSLLLVLVFSFSVMLLASCNGDNGYNGPKTELKVLSFRVEDKDFYKWMNNEFEKEHPEVDIVYEAVDTQNYPTLLQSRLTAGEVDVFGSQPTFFTSEVYTSKMLDLKDLDIWDNVYDYVLTECDKGGSRFIAPTNVVNGVVFYNKKLFADAGITSTPKTWTEFINVCETLKTHLGGITAKQAPIVAGLLDSWPISIMVDIFEATAVRANNPDFFFDLATEETDLGDPLVTDMFNKLKQVSQYFESGATGTQYALTAGYFSTGKFGMMIDGSWQLSQIRAAEPDFEVGTFILPCNDDQTKNNYVCYKTGGGFSAVKGTGVEDLAKEYIKFHMRDDVLQKYADDCMMGPVKSTTTCKDPLAKEFYQTDGLNKVYLAENMFVRGMESFNPSEVSNLFTGRTTVDALVTKLKNSNKGLSSVWSAYVPDWIATYYPERLN